MESWQKIRLGDYCKTNSATFGKSDNYAFVNYLDTGNITENIIDEIQYIDTTVDKLPSRARRKVSFNSIVYSTVRPNQKHFGIIKTQPENFLVSTGFAVIDADEKQIDSDFLYHYLTQKDVVEHLHAIAEQSTSAYPSIKPIDIENLEIMIPDIETQKKISSILTLIQNKQAGNCDVNKNLEEQAQALFKSWFVDFTPFDGTMPESWNLGTVSDIIELYDSQRKPLSGNERDKMDKIYPYYGATSCMDYVDDYLFDGKYLLLGEDGTVVDAAGYPILQYIWGKFWVNNHAHIMTGKHGYNVESLYLFFRQTNVKSIVTGAVQPKINQANLRSIQTLLPPVAIMDDFNATIEPLFGLIRNNRDENKRLESLRDSLLPKLMSGELDVSEIDL